MMNAVLVYSQPQPTTLFAFDYVKELRKDELEQSTNSITSSGMYVCVYVQLVCMYCEVMSLASKFCKLVNIFYYT